MTSRFTLRRVHYGWIIIVAGALVLFSCLGLARFSYTMVLPAMQAGLGFSCERMGFIGSGNFVGYFVAVLLSPALIRGFQPRLVIATGLLLIALCMLGIGWSQSFFTISVLYALVGHGKGR